MIKGKVDSKALENALKSAMPKILQSQVSDIKTGGRVLAAICARLTFPSNDKQGGGVSDKPPQSIMRRIKGDILRTQTTFTQLGRHWRKLEAADPNLSKEVYRRMKRRIGGPETEEMIHNLLRKAGISWGEVNKEKHQSARINYWGGVNKGREPDHIVLNGGEKKIAKYTGEVQAKIGNAKAGWARAMKSLGGNVSKRDGIKAWFNTGKHKRANGSFRLVSTPNGVVLKITNHVPYIDKAFPPSQKARAAREFPAQYQDALEKKLAAKTAAALKRQLKKQNG